MLIAGGGKRQGAQAAIIFDADAMRFDVAPRPNVMRNGGTAMAIAEGRVLVAGGAPASNGEAEIYDMTRERWYECGRPGSERFNGAALRLADGRVLHIGGASASGKAVLEIDVWTP